MEFQSQLLQEIINFLLHLDKEEVIRHLNEQNFDTYQVLKNVHHNLSDTNRTLELNQKNNKKLKSKYNIIFFLSKDTVLGMWSK